MATQFQHQRLADPSSIRVVDLYPSPRFNAPIKTTVREIILQRKRHICEAGMKYEAISYCWGEPIKDHSIICNGRELFVTKNCYDALFCLRNSFCTRTLWIDSICIDQTDTPSAQQERETQIPLMGDIYFKAQQVIIWLGHGDNSIPSLIRQFKLMRYIYFPGQHIWKSSFLTPIGSMIRNKIKSSGEWGQATKKEPLNKLIYGAREGALSKIT